MNELILYIEFKKLLIHDILQITDQILSYSTFSTKKICRLISREWEREATKYLCIRKNPFTATVPSVEAYARLYRRDSSESDNEGEAQFQSQHNFLCLPANCNCLIVPCDIGPNFYPTVCQLLLNFGRQIRFLELRNADWTLSQLRDCLYRYLPKLEELVLAEDFVLPKINQKSNGLIEYDPQSNSVKLLPKLRSIKFELQDENLQNLANLQFLQELFTIAPNVESIRGSRKSFSQNSTQHSTIFSSLLFRSIAESEVLIRTRSLTYLDINVEMRNADIDLLLAANFPLHTFHLALDMVATSPKVDTLLSSLKGTLRRLKITHRGCIRTSPNMINLQNLEYFALHGYETELRGDPRRRDSIVLDQALYFVFRFVPLCLFPGFIEGCEALRKLTELRLCLAFYAPKDIYNLKSLFPCLKKLRVSFLNDDTLRRICTDYPDLEELGATEGVFTDTVLCGISPLIQEILHNGVTNDVKDDRLRELPNITNMKSK